MPNLAICLNLLRFALFLSRGSPTNVFKNKWQVFDRTLAIMAPNTARLQPDPTLGNPTTDLGAKPSEGFEFLGNTDNEIRANLKPPLCIMQLWHR